MYNLLIKIFWPERTGELIDLIIKNSSLNDEFILECLKIIRQYAFIFCIICPLSALIFSGYVFALFIFLISPLLVYLICREYQKNWVEPYTLGFLRIGVALSPIRRHFPEDWNFPAAFLMSKLTFIAGVAVKIELPDGYQHKITMSPLSIPRCGICRGDLISVFDFMDRSGSRRIAPFSYFHLQRFCADKGKVCQYEQQSL